jgi:2-oxoglutarate ferredoxin oxidoreductase subunit gamma
MLTYVKLLFTDGNKMEISIRFAGSGGQGTITAGVILARAATLYENQYATLFQNYGAAARGGLASSEVKLSPQEIIFPNVVRPNILVAMSQEAVDTYIEDIAVNGLFIYDEGLVKDATPKSESIKKLGIEATQIAIDLGNKVVANIIMLGFLVGVTEVVSKDTIEKAALEVVPTKYKTINVRALEVGFAMADKVAEQIKKE